MRTDYETLKLDRVEDHILVVTLNRPERANAMNTQMGLDLRDLWRDLYVDQEDVRCVIMTGSGEKAFCAGGDLKDRALWDDFQQAYQDAIRETSTEWAPWYVIPADRKWYRNLMVAETLVATMESLDLSFPDGEAGLDEVKIP